MYTRTSKVFRILFLIASTLFGFVTLLRLPKHPNAGRDSDSYYTGLSRERVDWSRYAYTQYATDRSYLCNSVMIFEALHRLGTKADLVLMYPSKFLVSENDSSREARLLRFARDNYGVKLKPIEVIMKGGGGGKSTHCAARVQTKYERSTMVNELHEAPCFQSNGLRQSSQLRL